MVSVLNRTCGLTFSLRVDLELKVFETFVRGAAMQMVVDIRMDETDGEGRSTLEATSQRGSRAGR